MSDALAPGTQLGPYEIVELIGAGGMGQVYRAHDPRLERNVAIKTLAGPGKRDPDLLRRFETEAKAVGALHHPNLLVVYDAATSFTPGRGGYPMAVESSLRGTSRVVAPSLCPDGRSLAYIWARALSNLYVADALG